MSTLSTSTTSKKSAAKWKLSAVVKDRETRGSRGSSTSDDVEADRESAKEASLMKVMIDHLNMSKSEFCK